MRYTFVVVDIVPAGVSSVLMFSLWSPRGFFTLEISRLGGTCHVIFLIHGSLRGYIEFPVFDHLVLTPLLRENKFEICYAKLLLVLLRIYSTLAWS